jgi:hypothetical protein
MIFTQIWHGVDTSNFRRWLNNFQTDDEKYFAARILDALIFRSDAQTRALALHLFQTSLPSALEENTPNETDQWIDRLRGIADPGIRLVPVIRPCDPPTKSGPLVCRLLKRHLSLNDNWMIWPNQVERHRSRGITTFVLIDDFLGTGYQFKRFFKELLESLQGNSCRFVYLPLVAYARGISRMQSKFAHLKIDSAEVLDESHRLFSDDCSAFIDGVNTVAMARDFYSKLMTKVGPNLRAASAFGYERLSLAFAFEHATPNATLPIFWASEAGLQPLFVR